MTVVVPIVFPEPVIVDAVDQVAVVAVVVVQHEIDNVIGVSIDNRHCCHQFHKGVHHWCVTLQQCELVHHRSALDHHGSSWRN